MSARCELRRFRQPLVTHLIWQPHDLKRTVALNRAAFVVVNRFAGTREQTRCGIVLVHDEIGVGFVTLERDADNHLTNCRAGERVSSTERLRSEQDVNAERTTLPNDAIQQQSRALRHAIIFHE